MKSIIILAIFLFHLTSGQSFNIADFVDKTIESIGGFLPVNRSDITFRLWTRDQNTTYIPLTIGNLKNVSSIRRNKPFKIITHGYFDSANSSWMLAIKNAYLQKDNYNVILVDWQKPAKTIYPLAARYVKDVGTLLGQLVFNLNQTIGIPFSNIHLIGHSLGAHISGLAGQYIQSLNYTIGRISGCDPAGPLFFLTTAQNRLNKNDAKFVDVIHTDSLMYGYILPLGHIDFYPNGGIASQPGCHSLDGMKDIIDGCSHTRSHDLFIESINSNGFISKACSNYYIYKYTKICANTTSAVMGENVNQALTGLYQLTTNSASPFARNGTI